MKRCVILFFFLLSINFSLKSESLSLKQKFEEAQIGDFFVTEQNKNISFLHIYDKKDQTLMLEEVSIAAAGFPRGMDWKQWFEKGAPQHGSWTISQVDLNTGKFLDSYSFTHNGWIDLSEDMNFLTTLMNLPFERESDQERKKVGLPPGYGKPDHRALWTPRVNFEGNCLKHVPFTVWKARWPNDGSELARKMVEVYLPEKMEGSNYPTYFPYWVEIDGKIGSAKVRIISSGKGAISPKTFKAPGA